MQRYALECSRQIKHIKKDVIFVAPGNVLYPELAAELDIKIIGKFKGHLWEQFDLYPFLKQNGYPPLLNLANTAPLFYQNNYITIHDLAYIHHPEWNSLLFAKWYRYLIPRIAKKAQHLFTVSHTIQAEIHTAFNIPADGISVTCNGIAPVFETADDAVLPKKKQLLAVGRFSLRKNHDKLISAFTESSIAADYQLLIVGDKEEIARQLATGKQTYQHPNIKIIDQPDDKALICLYQESEILVSLSAYEGFGLPVLEGLFFGCKVLCSDIPVYRELFDKYVYFCDPFEKNSIITSLSAVAAQDSPLKNVVKPLFEKYNYRQAARLIINKIAH